MSKEQGNQAVMDEVKAWQSRPLDEIYPIVFLDCIVVKCRQEGKVSNVSVYLALGVNMDGHKELLGIWIAKSEGAKFWLGVITELQNRGVKDIFIACVDGLNNWLLRVSVWQILPFLPEIGARAKIFHGLGTCRPRSVQQVIANG